MTSQKVRSQAKSMLNLPATAPKLSESLCNRIITLLLTETDPSQALQALLEESLLWQGQNPPEPPLALRAGGGGFGGFGRLAGRMNMNNVDSAKNTQSPLPSTKHSISDSYPLRYDIPDDIYWATYVPSARLQIQLSLSHMAILTNNSTLLALLIYPHDTPVDQRLSQAKSLISSTMSYNSVGKPLVLDAVLMQDLKELLLGNGKFDDLFCKLYKVLFLSSPDYLRLAQVPYIIDPECGGEKSFLELVFIKFYYRTIKIVADIDPKIALKVVSNLSISSAGLMRNRAIDRCCRHKDQETFEWFVSLIESMMVDGGLEDRDESDCQQSHFFNPKYWISDPIYACVSRANLRMVLFCLDQGCSFFPLSPDNDISILEHAVEKIPSSPLPAWRQQSREMIEYLLSRDDVRALLAPTAERPDRSLQLAVEFMLYDICKLLYDAGARVGKCYDPWKLPFIWSQYVPLSSEEASLNQNSPIALPYFNIRGEETHYAKHASGVSYFEMPPLLFKWLVSLLPQDQGMAPIELDQALPVHRSILVEGPFRKLSMPLMLSPGQSRLSIMTPIFYAVLHGLLAPLSILLNDVNPQSTIKRPNLLARWSPPEQWFISSEPQRLTPLMAASIYTDVETTEAAGERAYYQNRFRAQPQIADAIGSAAGLKTESKLEDDQILKMINVTFTHNDGQMTKTYSWQPNCAEILIEAYIDSIIDGTADTHHYDYDIL